MRHLSILFIVTIAACGGGNYGDPLSQAEAESLCRRGCDYNNDCEPSEPTLEACYETCEDEVDSLASIAGGALEELSACRLELACSENGDICNSQLDTQDYQEALVDDCAEYISRCDVVNICELDNLELLSEPFADALSACFTGPCDEAADCYDDVLDEYNLD